MGKDCKYCGAYISDSVGVCPACGKKVKPEKPSEAESYTRTYGSGSGYSSAGAAGYANEKEQPEPEREEPRQENRAYTYKEEYERRYGTEAQGGDAQRSQYVYTETENDDVKRNKAISYLCYFGPLFLVPYLTRHDSEFVRFHSNQGLLLLLADIAINVCSAVPVIGWIIKVIGWIFVICGFIGGLSNVSKGLKKPLPVIGEITLLK